MANKKWKKGFSMLCVEDYSSEIILNIREYALQCDEFIVALPDDEAWYRVTNYNRNRDATEAQVLLKELSWITESIIISKKEMDYLYLHDQIGFDMCIMGSHFGNKYEAMTGALREKGVDVISIIPETYSINTKFNALDIVLEACDNNTEYILFGTGVYFELYMNSYGKKYSPKYAIDNNDELWGTFKSGVLVKQPDSLKEEPIERTMVVLCGKSYGGMIEQIKSYGNYEYRPMLCNNEIAVLEELGNYYRLEDEVLERVHEIDIKMLKAVDEVCRKNNITYFLAYGSLLGAIRNGGPIPWDNDIDFLMTRDQYKRLEDVRNELEEGITIVTPMDIGDNRYYDSVSRVIYHDSYVNLNKDMCDYYRNLNNRLNIDLFLMDKTRDDWRGWLQRTELAIIYGLMNAYRHPKLFDYYDKKTMLQNKILVAVGKMFSLKVLQGMADRVARRFNDDPKATLYFGSNGDFVTLHQLYPDRIFSVSKDINYAGIQTMAPVGTEEFLSLKYGNYMELPEIRLRIPHWGRFKVSAGLFEFHAPGGSEG